MSWLTFLLLGLLLFILYMILNQPNSKDMPPGPKGLPLVGNLFDLLFEDSIKFFARLGREYGPVSSVQLGLRRVVVINSAPAMTQAFIRQGDLFNHRPRGTVFNMILKGRGIADAEGQLWREMRRFTLHGLRDFGLGKNTIETYVQHEVAELLEIMQTKVGKPYNPHYDLATSVLNIVWHMFVGEKFAMGDKTLRWIVDSLEMSLQIVEQGGFLNFTPMLQFIGTFCKPTALRVGVNVFHRFDYFRSLTKKHKETLDDPDRVNDIMYMYLEEQRRQIEQGNADTNFTDDQLAWLMSDLFIVGLDTTVTAMRWTFLLLASHPDKQARLQQEIDSVVGRDRVPMYEDRTSMNYTEAFISEIFRYSSITPIVMHSNPEETSLYGYRIPKRTWVAGNIWGVHWDQKVWGDPEVFRPERFLDEEGNLLRSEHLVVFSLGRRNCLGESLARIEVFVILTGLLQRFTLKFLPGLPPPPLEYRNGVTLNPYEYEVLLDARGPADPAS